MERRAVAAETALVDACAQLAQTQKEDKVVTLSQLGAGIMVRGVSPDS